mmetsp:Transcript_14576/g.22488  ORF Transcript_14576/g.22488 Transcript_14576/m.22488 type:complete len:216 (+) Transcript_14576:134-781(+)|eukprot:CAMPEP_0196819134 /NCGR_PEP_ID=MMETSP1362-20130617/69180_1 /TAXON_ID=163516 /ORGANISM="Leptocylindrus danicus, Strain CCMP1856" /LENGTH=215 /DNA_ID=CAMNT_0042197505 /DNA_START=107 /DNA_END=754 /DNA_ORIENTATION=+
MASASLQRINALKKEASLLTKKLWKSSLKSIQAIALGNAVDEVRFSKLEKLQLEKPTMLPVNRDDELKSRANYYYNYAREQIEQESDIFEMLDWSLTVGYKGDHVEELSSSTSFTKDQIHRYFYFLRKGEEQRLYILRKYKFEDPCPTSFDSSRVDALEDNMLRTLNAEIMSHAIDDKAYSSHEDSMGANTEIRVESALERIFSEDRNEDDWDAK